MTRTEDFRIVRDALEEFYSRRDGCPDKTCGVCRQLQNQFIDATDALDRLVAAKPAPTETHGAPCKRCSGTGTMTSEVSPTGEAMCGKCRGSGVEL